MREFITEELLFPDGKVRVISGEPQIERAIREGAEKAAPVMVKHPNGIVSAMNQNVADIMRRKPGYSIVLAMPPIPGSVFKILEDEK